MIVSIIKKSERKPGSSFVNLSRMDYELVCNVLRLLEETRLDDEELAFLLGKRNQYFFDVIDPQKKQKLKTDQLDPLAAIFGNLTAKKLSVCNAKRHLTNMTHYG